MKTSKKRLIAGIIAITCCCSLCSEFALNDISGGSLNNGFVVNAAESSVSGTTIDSDTTGEEDIVEEDIITGKTASITPLSTITTADGISVDAVWSDNQGYAYAISEIVTKVTSSDGSSSTDTVYAVAVTGYNGSGLTAVLHNKVELPEDIQALVNGKELILEDEEYSIAVANRALYGKSIKSIDMVGVKYLGDQCFMECADLLTIEVPESVEYIGTGVFKNAGLSSLYVSCKMKNIPNEFCMGSKLQNIEFTYESSIKTIGSNAFSNCLLTQYPLVDMGSSVSIGSSAFSGCKKITELTLGDNVKSVGYRAFASMPNLVSVDIGSNTEDIGVECFNGCKLLSSVTLNERLTSIGNNAFSNCVALAEFPVFPESVVDSSTEVAGLGTGVFSGCTALASFTFSDSVTIVPDSFFSGCTALKTVTFGTGISNVGNQAFNDCTNLKEVVHNNTINTIGDKAFNNCRSLKAIIANKCKTIGAEAYSGCVSITSINVDADKCGEAVFKNCSGIKTATLGTSIAENLPKNMFCGCSGLEGFVDTDFSNVQVISESAFIHCTSLKEVDFPSAVKILPSAFENCKSLTRISEGNLRIENYGDKCFKGCTSLEQNINSTVVVIGEESLAGSSISDVILRGAIDRDLSVGNDAFSGCTKLTHVSIQIPENISYTFGSGVFRDCTALDNCTFGGTEFSEEMFSGCSSLKNVVAKSATTVGVKAFSGCTSLEEFNLGDAAVFEEIDDYAFENCESLKQTYADTTTSLAGEGQFAGCASITEANVCTLTASIFKDCVNLSSVTGISDIMGSIPDYAFAGCKKITSLDFLPNEKKQYIYGVSCFEGSGLRGKLQITTTEIAKLFNINIAERAFADCTGLTEIDICVNKVGDEAFMGCTGLHTVKTAVNSIGAKSFYGCVNLVSLDLSILFYPYGLTSIGDGAFQNCNLLREVILDERSLAVASSSAGKICNIGDKAFGFVDDTPINNFLLIGVLKNDFGIKTGVSNYIDKYGIMFQDISTYNAEARAEEKKLPGDLNLDGEVTIADAVIMQQWLTKQPVSIYGGNADVNEDGVVNVFDNILIRRIVMNDGVMPEVPEQPAVTTTVVEDPTETTTTTVAIAKE